MSFAALMGVIAPAKYTKEEAAKVSYRLARLNDDGLAEKHGVGLWRAAFAA